MACLPPFPALPPEYPPKLHKTTSLPAETAAALLPPHAVRIPAYPQGGQWRSGGRSRHKMLPFSSGIRSSSPDRECRRSCSANPECRSPASPAPVRRAHLPASPERQEYTTKPDRSVPACRTPKAAWSPPPSPAWSWRRCGTGCPSAWAFPVPDLPDRMPYTNILPDSGIRLRRHR